AVVSAFFADAVVLRDAAEPDFAGAGGKGAGVMLATMGAMMPGASAAMVAAAAPTEDAGVMLASCTEAGTEAVVSGASAIFFADPVIGAEDAGVMLATLFRDAAELVLAGAITGFAAGVAPGKDVGVRLASCTGAASEAVVACTSKSNSQTGSGIALASSAT